ncbi:MAG: hypothetical protein K2M90_02945, partial [Treponemataceae bacterium]|nr:hypothetical protein [Treponemataceae bacterium]
MTKNRFSQYDSEKLDIMVRTNPICLYFSCFRNDGFKEHAFMGRGRGGGVVGGVGRGGGGAVVRVRV